MAGASGFQSLVENLHTGLEFLNDPVKVELYTRGRKSFLELDPIEQVMFGQMLNAVVTRFATTIEFEAGGLINKSYVIAHGEIKEDLFRSKGVQVRWSMIPQEFLNREVCHWIEQNTERRSKTNG